MSKTVKGQLGGRQEWRGVERSEMKQAGKHLKDG